MSTRDEVGATTFTTPSELEIVATRVFDAPRTLVWEAWTKSEHLPNWMVGPPGWSMPVCEVDLRLGGEWHFVWRKDDDSEMEMRGVYREIQPPERLVSSSSWGPEWPETTETLTFAEEDGRTTVTQAVLYPSREARDAAAATGMKDGMSRGFDLLDEYLRSLS